MADNNHAGGLRALSTVPLWRTRRPRPRWPVLSRALQPLTGNAMTGGTIALSLAPFMNVLEPSIANFFDTCNLRRPGGITRSGTWVSRRSVLQTRFLPPRDGSRGGSAK